MCVRKGTAELSSQLCTGSPERAPYDLSSHWVMRGRSEKSEPTLSTPTPTRSQTLGRRDRNNVAETRVHTNGIERVGRCSFITAFTLEIHSQEDLSRFLNTVGGCGGSLDQFVVDSAVRPCLPVWCAEGICCSFCGVVEAAEPKDAANDFQRTGENMRVWAFDRKKKLKNSSRCEPGQKVELF